MLEYNAVHGWLKVLHFFEHLLPFLVLAVAHETPDGAKDHSNNAQANAEQHHVIITSQRHGLPGIALGNLYNDTFTAWPVAALGGAVLLTTIVCSSSCTIFICTHIGMIGWAHPM